MDFVHDRVSVSFRLFSDLHRTVASTLLPITLQIERLYKF